MDKYYFRSGRGVEFNVTLKKLFVWNDKGEKDSCVLFLAGRAESAVPLLRAYSGIGLNGPLLCGATPDQKAWYSMPFSAIHQKEAVAGLPKARDVIETAIAFIKKKYGIERRNMALVGYSAGSVMAIEVASHSDEPFAAVVSHAGAILQPHNLPECQCPETKFLLTHYEDDMVFDWAERYLPMKRALMRRGYDVSVIEGAAEEKGGHGIFEPEVIKAKNLIESCFGE